MDKRINRFKICDMRFYSHLARVFKRLPEEVREKVLNDKSLQILVDEDALDTCVRRYAFDPPIETLIYLNPRILIEPEHIIIYMIAWGIGDVILSQSEPEPSKEAVENLLIQWGFEEELKAMRYDRALEQSKGYQAGYRWARGQSKDYLMQHFSLYFDEWDEKGPCSLSGVELDTLYHLAETGPILDDATRMSVPDFDESEKNRVQGGFSVRQAFLAGILTAVKELKLNELFSSKTCVTRHPSADNVNA